jgi:hypothetical protein
VSKLHIFLKESKGMHEVIQLISNFFVQQKHAPFYESTCSLDEPSEKSNHTKTSKF